MTKRKRGRPRKFRGDKDRASFAEVLDQTLRPVVDFVVLARYADRKKRGAKDDDRYQWALGVVAARYGISTRTLERRHQQLRRDVMLGQIVDNIADSVARSGGVPLLIEQLPKAD